MCKSFDAHVDKLHIRKTTKGGTMSESAVPIGMKVLQDA